jgi:hypothetical protein
MNINCYPIQEEIAVAHLEVEDPADFPALLADLQTKAADATMSTAIWLKWHAAIWS